MAKDRCTLLIEEYYQATGQLTPCTTRYPEKKSQIRLRRSFWIYGAIFGRITVEISSMKLLLCMVLILRTRTRASSSQREQSV